MGLGTGSHNPFVGMSDAQLSIELVQLVKFSPLTDNAQKLLLVVGQRLSGAAYPTEEQAKPAGHNTFIRGINLADKDTTNTMWERVTNLVNETVFDAKLETNQADREPVRRAILTAINDRISQDRLVTAQVYVQVNKDLSNWRVLVDIPSPELTGTIIRHYICNSGLYYAYPIEFLNTPKSPTPFNLIPPSWNDKEKWESVQIDFEADDVVHYYTIPGSASALTGTYVCDLKGNLKLHHDLTLA